MDNSQLNWFKSSYSGGQGLECVEAAFLVDVAAVRDSKDPDGGRLEFGAAAWRAFLGAVKGGEFEG